MSQQEINEAIVNTFKSVQNRLDDFEQRIAKLEENKNENINADYGTITSSFVLQPGGEYSPFCGINIFNHLSADDYYCTITLKRIETRQED